MTSHNSIGKYRHLVNRLGTGGPVRIVSKLDQFQIVTVVELRSYALFLTTLSFVVGLIVASTASLTYYSQFHCSQSKISRFRQMRLQDISAGKAICSQLETLEKRAINLFLTYLLL